MSDKTLQELINVRRSKLDGARERGDAFPNTYRPSMKINQFIDVYEAFDKRHLDSVGEATEHSLAGRVKLHRVMGKTSFCQIGDHTGVVQLYLRKQNSPDELGVPEDQYSLFKKFDLGDIIYARGIPYRTNKGELSLRVTEVRLLSKCLRPLPDKHHGLNDQETRYRQRYLDLMVNPESVHVFAKRSLIISQIRSGMAQSGFLEVETPMMHSIPGGATARPFVTHHNALDTDLYLRVAPELHLKRLIVGGFTKVFEINRNFRNEGLSPRHNPEFTMMEFYSAYWDYRDLISFIKPLLASLAVSVSGSYEIQFGEHTLNFGAIQEMTMEEAVQRYFLKDRADVTISYESLRDWFDECYYDQVTGELDGPEDLPALLPETKGGLIAYLFEQEVEHQLIQPTFITDFPIEISPLARRNNDNPEIADRFELFIAGQEIANGFSELNDPDDQATRFKAQVAARDAGDKEAMYYDADYITALEYGMPPTAGAGIGIDRLVMIFLNQSNIRDVVLFPQMRPQE